MNSGSQRSPFFAAIPLLSLLIAGALPAHASPDTAADNSCQWVKGPDGIGRPTPGCLSEADIQPCEALLRQSLANSIERGEQAVRDYGPDGRKRRYHHESVSNSRLKTARERLAKQSGMSALEYALSEPPYTPLYDLEATHMFIRSSKENLEILRSGDEKRMNEVIGVTFRGKELEEALAGNEKFLCMLNLRLAQLQGKRPAAASARPATTPTGSSGGASRDAGSVDLTPVASSAPKSDPVNHCLKFKRDSEGRIELTNACDFTVQYSWCLKFAADVKDRSTFACKDPYQGEGADGIAAGATRWLQGSTNASGVRWMACRGKPGEVIPLLGQHDRNGCY